MTCVIGMVSEDGTIFMAGDSIASDGSHSLTIANPKVFINGDYLIGYTTSYRMGQLLQFSDLPKRTKKYVGGTYEFMVREFIPAIRAILEEGGYTTIEDNEETGGTFLVGVNGKLYFIEADFSVIESTDPYVACGSGQETALSALYAILKLDPDMSCDSALELAVTASAYVKVSVSLPVVVEEL